MNEIIMIPIEYIEHHPENPRLDLGDLTELTQSIKANGIMQNLTVVPYETSDLKEEDKDPCYKKAMNRNCECWRWYERAVISGKMNRYYAVIGNRRLEAAKAAGLHAVPCAISDMSHEQQLATMLQENMQRSNLTVYEQAHGIQMMLDLGYSREEVQELTGFSRQTVDRRITVASLPKEETKAAVDGGFDLLDLIEIAKIDDENTQKALLGKPREALKQEINIAKRTQERRKLIQRYMPQIESWAKPLKEQDRYSSKYDQIRSYPLAQDPKITPPDDVGKRGYWYYIPGWGTDVEIYVAAKKVKNEKTPGEIRLEKKRAAAKELNEQMRQRREAFVASLDPDRKTDEMIRSKAMEWIFGWKCKYITGGGFFTSYHSWDGNLFRKLAGMPKEDGKDDTKESLLEEIRRRGIPTARAFLAWALCGGIVSDDRAGYCSTYNGAYSKDEDMDRVYEILKAAGYVESYEEQDWRNGTHDIYVDRMDD